MDEVKVKKFIYCTIRRNGNGTQISPIRVITEIYDFDGNLVAEYDPHKVQIERIMAFINTCGLEDEQIQLLRKMAIDNFL